MHSLLWYNGIHHARSIWTADADAATMEELRARLEAHLNEVTRRAYARIGRPEEAAHG